MAQLYKMLTIHAFLLHHIFLPKGRVKFLTSAHFPDLSLTFALVDQIYHVLRTCFIVRSIRGCGFRFRARFCEPGID
jgi:hypothetical protein